MPTSKPANHRTLLLAGDNKNTVLAEMTGSIHRFAYSPYGQQSSRQEVRTHLGFNGELREAKTDWYFLGNGYRVYDPRLMRFHSPDKFSPFGKGGLNGYAYCGCEPANRVDPTGEAWWFEIFADVWTIFSPVGRGGANASRTTTVTTQSSTGGILGAMANAIENTQRNYPKAINKKPLGKSRKQTSAFPIQQSSNSATKSVHWAPDLKSPTTSTNITTSTVAQSGTLSRSSSSSSVSSNSSSASTPSTVSTVSSISNYSADSGYRSSPAGSIRSNGSADNRLQMRHENLRRN